MRLAWSLTPAPLPLDQRRDDHRAVTADVLLASHYWLIGSANEMAEQPVGLREWHGISYVVAEAAVESFAPMVARLAGR